ncbi:MAG: hypothetical protein JWM74_3969 [Myxococcaceae bacterium]|nr:hypothetical protein [Myxococcaceae bacterium]
MSSRPTAIPGEGPKRAPRPDAPAVTVTPIVSVEAETPFAALAPDAIAAEPTFDDDAADFFRVGESLPPPATVEVDDERDDERDHAARGDVSASDRVALAAAARRRAFSRHVLGVVALAVVVCIAAFVRSATGAPSSVSTPVATAIAKSTSPAPETVVAKAEAPAAVASAEAPAPAAPAAAPTVAPDAPAEISPAAARVAREDARRLLEGGSAAAAAAAGVRSVDLDPTDAEAWLILGAAYQLAGKGTEARNAFRSCSKLAKRGNVGECRAFVP